MSNVFIIGSDITGAALGNNSVYIGTATQNVGIGGITPSVRLDVDGAIALRPNDPASAGFILSGGNVTIDSLNRSYTRFSATAPRTITNILNGRATGQIIIIENTGLINITINRAASQVQMSSSSFTLGANDLISFIRNGVDWLEMDRSDNL